MPGGTAGDVSVPELHVLSTAEGAARAAAGFLSTLSEECVAARGRFSIAPSGGSTPRRLYQILASAPHVGSISWDRWQVFWGDERCVPPDHGDSNYRMARQALLDHVPVPPPQVHRIRGEVAPETAAGEYENEIGLVFQSTVASFDLILLGIGDDGHIASWALCLLFGLRARLLRGRLHRLIIYTLYEGTSLSQVNQLKKEVQRLNPNPPREGVWLAS